MVTAAWACAGDPAYPQRRKGGAERAGAGREGDGGEREGKSRRQCEEQSEEEAGEGGEGRELMRRKKLPGWRNEDEGRQRQEDPMQERALRWRKELTWQVQSG